MEKVKLGKSVAGPAMNVVVNGVWASVYALGFLVWSPITHGLSLRDSVEEVDYTIRRKIEDGG